MLFCSHEELIARGDIYASIWHEQLNEVTTEEKA